MIFHVVKTSFSHLTNFKSETLPI